MEQAHNRFRGFALRKDTKGVYGCQTNTLVAIVENPYERANSARIVKMA
jgi:hypothetical protein